MDAQFEVAVEVVLSKGEGAEEKSEEVGEGIGILFLHFWR